MSTALNHKKNPSVSVGWFVNREERNMETKATATQLRSGKIRYTKAKTQRHRQGHRHR